MPAYKSSNRPPGPGVWISGFTLIELLIVLVIVGITVSMVVPKLFGAYESIKVSAEERKLADILEFVKMKAFLRQRFCRIEFNDHTINITENITDQSKGIDFEYIRFTRTSITFNGNGFPSAEKLVYYVRGRTKNLDII